MNNENKHQNLESREVNFKSFSTLSLKQNSEIKLFFHYACLENKSINSTCVFH